MKAFRNVTLVLMLGGHWILAAVGPGVADLNTPRQFPTIDSRRQWDARATEIRQQVLVSCGLWPMPKKEPLHARVFDKVARDGYTVEKVWFQSYPGVYVGGNLYRPLKTEGRIPAVLNPHGHWANGRMADNKDGSIAGRCISLARMGMVAFSYDMTGYNDTFFPDHGDVPDGSYYIRHRRFATNHVNQLWSISQMGLQTWNSIRALDFLESLPEVDHKRLACTGESGGGTQTFMLGAVDDRLAALAPVVMVSHSMQGGCSCENAPGLRVKYSNMEIAAAAAPLPQIMVGASGDWTKTMLTVEGPAVASVYKLLGASDRLRYVRFDFDHNYNQTSREAVYGWFNKWLLDARSFDPVSEPSFTKEPDDQLRVFPDGKLPDDAIPENQLIQYLVSNAEKQLGQLAPSDRKSLEAYKKLMNPAWARTLQIEWPSTPESCAIASEKDGDYSLGVADSADAPVVVNVSRGTSKASQVALLVTEDGGLPDPNASPLRERLLNEGWTVLNVKSFSPCSDADPFSNFFTVYNRTKTQQRVGDLVRVCAFAREHLRAKHITLFGSGAAGPWALLAAPAGDAVVADCNQVDTSLDEALLERNLFVPGLRRISGFEGAALLAAPHPLFMHNTGGKFAVEMLRNGYTEKGEAKGLTIVSGVASATTIAEWAIRAK